MTFLGMLGLALLIVVVALIFHLLRDKPRGPSLTEAMLSDLGDEPPPPPEVYHRKSALLRLG